MSWTQLNLQSRWHVTHLIHFFIKAWNVCTVLDPEQFQTWSHVAATAAILLSAMTELSILLHNSWRKHDNTETVTSTPMFWWSMITVTPRKTSWIIQINSKWWIQVRCLKLANPDDTSKNLLRLDRSTKLGTVVQFRDGAMWQPFFSPP